MTQLVWDRAGAGAPLLLLHGIGSTHDDFIAVRAALESEYEVLAVDLPGHGGSPPMSRRPTVSAIADILEADLDMLGFSRVHILGNSLGGRLALELARRDRALSVVAIAPSGLNIIPERIYQGTALSMTRLMLRTFRPVIAPLARFRLTRAGMLAGLRARPWRASEREVLAMRDGLGDSEGFWSMLFWSTLVDIPRGLRNVRCPVILAQGNADTVALGQTPRYLLLVPGATFKPLWFAGHAPMSDVPAAIVRLVEEATRRAGPPSTQPPSTQPPSTQASPLGPSAPG
ncbi:MAG TPA: alpha/beta fold hydrolase [Nannocystis sp.]